MDVNDDAGLLKKRGAHTSIASRLAPTMVLCRTQNMCSPQITCGSELARDGRQRWRGPPEETRRSYLHREQARSYNGSMSDTEH